jgi:DNA-binding IclR family transcriptional regulator
VTTLPRQPNRSVLEGIEVLLAVARCGGPVGVRPLAREMGLTPTRLQRYLATLAHCGLLQQLPDRRYGAGPGIHALSAISLTASGLAPRAMQVLPQLADLDCLVALGVLWRRRVSYVYFQNPGSPDTRSLGNQSDFPAEDSVVGRVLLADWPGERIREAFPECGHRLCRETDEVRERGYARIDRPDGETGIAVPVGSPAVAGLAVSGRIDRRTVPALLRRLTKTAALLGEPFSTRDAS